MESRKSKRWDSLKNWFYGKGIFQNPIAKTYRKNNLNILSNSAYRIILSVLVLALLIASFYLLILILRVNNWIGQLFLIASFAALIYLPAKYFYVSTNQIIAELGLNISISNLKWSLLFLRRRQKSKNYRSLQAKMNRLRTSLLDFLEYSEILTPPVFNYELNRLKKRIDIFFNSASEVLVPISKSFSRAQDYDEEMAKMYYDSVEHPTEEEEAEMLEESQIAESGGIVSFDLLAMDEFLSYFWIVLFEREPKRYSPFSFKHPVNLIMLSRFFESWNSVLASCVNSKGIYERASKDIEEYYKSIGELESEKRQQRWRLRDDVIIVLVSVGLSTLIQYLISLT